MARLKDYTQFSDKQKAVMTWWHPFSPLHVYDAIICDGAVRSGKTFCTSLSFVSWAFFAFEQTDFALCGKTLTSLRRNILGPLLPHLRDLGFSCEEKISKNYVDLFNKQKKLRFHLFGGKDEGSAALIQGMTLGGVLFDEVALMPRSFVEQALARCSLPGARFWFNCNPEYPQHWFHREWIQKTSEKKALYFHFHMRDNPSLSLGILKRYQSLYSGAFYQRFVEGNWVGADGLVYPMFDLERHVTEPPAALLTPFLPSQRSFWAEPEPHAEYCISCDYGTVNPCSFGLWGRQGDVWYRLREYYWDSRQTGIQRTDEEHYRALEQLADSLPVDCVICDPSAASFLACIRRHGRFTALPAKNDVLAGIRLVADALQQDKLRFSPSCGDLIREFGLYTWTTGGGRDAPRKEHDHAMDDLRYFVATKLQLPFDSPDSFFAGSMPRI